MELIVLAKDDTKSQSWSSSSWQRNAAWDEGKNQSWNSTSSWDDGGDRKRYKSRSQQCRLANRRQKAVANANVQTLFAEAQAEYWHEKFQAERKKLEANEEEMSQPRAQLHNVVGMLQDKKKEAAEFKAQNLALRKKQQQQSAELALENAFLRKKQEDTEALRCQQINMFEKRQNWLSEQLRETQTNLDMYRRLEAKRADKKAGFE